MPVRRMTNLAGLTVAVVLVLWSLLIFSPSSSTRRNLAPESLFSTAHKTGLGNENKALSINDAFTKENLAIEGRDARALDAYENESTLRNASSFSKPENWMNAGKEMDLEASTHRILAVLLRYNENVDWLIQSNDSAEPILPTELYQAANIDPIGCVPSFPGMPNSSTSAESSSPITWPYWATDYVAEKCKNANLVEPMTVFDIERHAWLDAGLPWDMEIGAKLNLGRRLHHENGENAFENSTPMTTEPLPTAKINVPSLSPLPLHIIPTQGRESLAYLTAIIDHYDDLPDLMLFMHAHDVSWHTFQLGQRWSLQRLKVIGPRNLSSGFMQLGCYKLDDAYMFTRVVDANFDLPDRFRESIVGHFMQAWTEPGGLGEIFGESLPPPYIRAACCATFAVEKKAILQRKKEFYEKLRNWALRTAMDKYWTGIVMEFSWHMIFTGKGVYDPSPELCRKELYDI